MRITGPLDVLLSSHQDEFSRKRKRLKKLINKMSYLSCELLKNRGADSVDTKTRSIKAAKDCDFYVGIFGARYSELIQAECLAALDNDKRFLIYIMELKDQDRDSRLIDFINNELRHRVTYHRFRKRRDLERQISKDLGHQIIEILRTGLAVRTETKGEVKLGEQKLKQSIYSSESSSNMRKRFIITRNGKIKL